MKVLITGSGGQLGRELRRTAPPGIELICPDRLQCDITDRDGVLALMRAGRPELVINGAAFTEVDRAEAEPEPARKVNAVGAANLADAASKVGARLFHISTDYVFDGKKSAPYLPDDAAAPLGVYGATKLEGERLVGEISGGSALIVRSAWLYAAQGHNFVNTMLRLMGERASLSVVADQIGTPTWARTLAEALWAAAAMPRLRGIYHWTDAGVASWYDLAVAVQEEGVRLGLLAQSIPVVPIRTEDYPLPARRPACCLLDKTSTWRDFGLAGRHWRVCLRAMLREVKNG